MATSVGGMIHGSPLFEVRPLGVVPELSVNIVHRHSPTWNDGSSTQGVHAFSRTISGDRFPGVGFLVEFEQEGHRPYRSKILGDLQGHSVGRVFCPKSAQVADRHPLSVSQLQSRAVRLSPRSRPCPNTRRTPRLERRRLCTRPRFFWSRRTPRPSKIRRRWITLTRADETRS